MADSVESPKTRNLVLCFDGTGDFAAQLPTHVFRLFRCLERNDLQRIYYEGGVGTLKNAGLLSPIKKFIYQNLDLAAGFTIRESFLNAYKYLIHNWKEGDEIYIFGFSRGSYAARALAAGIKYFGIPEPEHENMLPYMWQWFSSGGDEGSSDEQDADNLFRRMNRLKGAFAEKGSSRRDVSIRFMGLWDTVTSFGLIYLRTLPGTSKLEKVNVLRHAVSIDEKRNMFPENLCSPNHANLREMWFAGVHRDIGGGGSRGKLGLSMIPYQWLLGEATKNGLGLRIDSTKLDAKKAIDPDPLGPANTNNLILVVYALIGLIPMRMWSERPYGRIKSALRLIGIDLADPPHGGFAWKWLKLWNIRKIPEGALVHESVLVRMKRADMHYKPRNVDEKKVQFVAE